MKQSFVTYNYIFFSIIHFN